MTITSRNFDLDVQMVREYLKRNEYVSVGTMNAYNPPEAEASEWRDFMDDNKTNWTHRLKVLRATMSNGNVVIDGFPKVALRHLYIKVSGKPIELEPCQPISISEVKPHDEWIRFRCMYCHTPNDPTEWVYSKDEPYTKPGKHGCDFPQVKEITDPTRDSIDSQWVKIQELNHDSTTTVLPLTLPCLFKGENMLWNAFFHERVSLIGIFRYKPVIEYGERTYMKWFEVFGIRKLDPTAHISLTEKDIQLIQSEQKKKGYLKKVVDSFAPHIWGMRPVKEALVLALASAKLRKPARIMLITDPGMAKSTFGEYCCLLMPNAQSVQMGRASSAGLTVSSEVDKETGRAYISTGSAAEAHESALFIDEAQLGEARDFMKLNDILSSGKIKYAMRGGQHGFVDANCVVVVFSNPYGGRFKGTEQSLEEVLGYMGDALPPFASRIHLLLLMRDKNTDEEERAIVEHMAKHHENDPLYMSKYQDTWYSETVMEDYVFELAEGFTMTLRLGAEMFGTTMLKKIFKYVTNHVPVEPLSQKEIQYMIDYYMKNRKDQYSAISKMVTKRFMNHGIELSQYIARLHGRSRPIEEDINHATKLLEVTMSVAALDPKSEDRLSVNTFELNYSETKIEKDKAINKGKMFREAMFKAMLDEEGRSKNFFTLDDIISVIESMPGIHWKMSGTNIADKYEIEKEIKKWHDNGKLINDFGEGKYTPK